MTLTRYPVRTKPRRSFVQRRRCKVHCIKKRREVGSGRIYYRNIRNNETQIDAYNMINTTIFKSAFIFLVLLSSAMALPVEVPETADIAAHSSKPSTDKSPATTGDHYDQRQNGTKNFRLNIDGVVFVVAPVEALLLAGEIDPSLFSFGPEGPGESPAKPGAAETQEDGKPIKRKSANSHGFKLSNLLGPILRRISP